MLYFNNYEEKKEKPLISSFFVCLLLFFPCMLYLVDNTHTSELTTQRINTFYFCLLCSYNAILICFYCEMIVWWEILWLNQHNKLLHYWYTMFVV